MSTFDDIIKQKADGHQAPVPPDAWDNIVQKKRKRRFGFFWWTAAMLLLCGLDTAWYVSMHSAQKSNVIVNNEIAAKQVSTKNGKDANQQQRTTPQGADSAATKAATDNSKLPYQKTFLEVALPAATKTKITQQQAIGELENTIASSRQDDIVVEDNEKKTTVKEKQPSSLAANGKQVKKIKGKAIFHVKGAATEEENEKQQQQNANVEIAVNIASDNIPQNDKTIAQNKLPAVVKNLPAKDSVMETAVKKKVTATAATENKKQPASNQKQSKKKHWFADIAATPVLPIQQYSQPASFVRTASSANSRSVFSGKLISTSIDPAVAFSLAIRKNISTKTFIGIGLQYLQLKEHIDLSGTETHTNYSIVNRLINTSNGPALINDTVHTVTEGSKQIAATNNYTFYSIPIFIQYNFIQKSSWSAGIAGGLFVNIFSQYKNEINQNGSALLTPTPQSNSTNSMGLDVYAGLRFGKMLGKKLEFFALPSMRWNLKEQSIKNSLVNKKIQQAGVSFGLSIQLK